MAEREGFEPSNQVSPITRLAGERLQPARPSLRKTVEKIPLLLNFGGSLQILILEILNVCLRLKLLSSLKLSKIEIFSTVFYIVL